MSHYVAAFGIGENPFGHSTYSNQFGGIGIISNSVGVWNLWCCVGLGGPLAFWRAPPADSGEGHQRHAGPFTEHV